MLKLKRKIVFLLLVVFIAASILSGCSANKEKGDLSSTTGTDDKDTAVKKLSIITVPAGAQFPDGKSIMNNDFFEAVKKDTGYDLDWQLFKTGAQNPLDDQINLLLAAGNAPDLIQTNGGPIVINLAKNGGLAELDTAFEKNANYLKKTYTKEVMDMGKYNGKLYSLPRYTGGAAVGSMAIRTDWLNELGLKAPKTLDEYYNVLKQFKEKKKDCIPLIADGTLYRMIDFMGAFGIYTDSGVPFNIDSGKAVYPMITDKGAEFIKYMSKLYSEGLIDKEFLVDKETLQKMIAGKGGMMMMNYVEIVRNMSAFKEKNPNGNIEYIDPPTGKNGEQGYRSQALSSMAWIVPKTSASKVNDCIKFLEKCNSSDKLVEIICYGMEGTHYTKDSSGIKTLPAFKDIAYKGYYSRVILDNRWDNNSGKLEGFDKYIEFADKFKKKNDILYATADIPSNSSAASELSKAMQDSVLQMIVEGYSDNAFNKMKDNFKKLKGEDILKEYQTWYDSRK